MATAVGSCRSLCKRDRLHCILMTLVALVLLLQFKSNSLPTTILLVGTAISKRSTEEASGREQIPEVEKRKDGNATNPLAIIHIGPRKTGSTTIQMCLGNKNVTAQLLREDSFVFVGKRGRKMEVRPYVRECLIRGAQCEEYQQYWTNFHQTLQRHRQNNTNIIYSEEGLMRIKDHGLRLLKEALEGFRVRVVVTYRRYDEWVLSEYHQVARDNMLDFGRAVPPFAMWHEKQIRGKRDNTFMPISRERMNEWRRFFPSVEIFNMHEASSMMEAFLCQMIPEAEATCNAAKSNLLSSLDNKHNLSTKTVDAILVTSAAIAANFTQEEALKLEAALSNVTKDLPLLCLSEDRLNEILNITLQREQDLVPDFFASEHGEIVLRRDFSKAVEEKRYCNVDIPDFLQNHAHRILKR